MEQSKRNYLHPADGRRREVQGRLVSIVATLRAYQSARVPHTWRVDTNGYNTAVMSNSLYHLAQKLFKD